MFLSFSSSADASTVQIRSNGGPLTGAEVHFIKKRQLLYYLDEFGDRGENVTIDPSLLFENPRLRSAYIALQAWKRPFSQIPLISLSIGSDLMFGTIPESSVHRHSTILRSKL